MHLDQALNTSFLNMLDGCICHWLPTLAPLYFIPLLSLYFPLYTKDIASDVPHIKPYSHESHN